MPDVNGQMQLQDYILELQNRGFDGFSPADLTSYINRGYYHVARRSRWYWEQTTDTFTIAPGVSYVDLWPVAGGELPSFRSLDRVYVTTAGQQRQLKPMDRDRFLQYYYSQDLTATVMQGEPSQYHIWNQKLYIVNPPSQSRAFRADYHRRVTAMVNPTDVPITPIHLDEAILEGALIRCHRRSQEAGLAQIAEAALEEFFLDMQEDEVELMDELPSRVKKDDTWL